MDNSNRDSIIERIQKLRKMTTQSGCSEAEAAFAARKVQQLIQEFEVQETELSLKADAQGCVIDSWTEFKAKVDDWARLTAVQIAKLYHCKVRLEHGFESPFKEMPELRLPWTKVQFFGYPQDVEACLATAEIICTAVNGEALKWRPADGRKTPSKLSDFRLGMIHRFNEMLIAMRSAPKPTGTSLIVLKDQLVTVEAAKQGFESAYSRVGRQQPRNEAAYRAGHATAGQYNLGRQTQVQASGLRIGSK